MENTQVKVKVIVGTWSGSQLGGVILFDLKTKKVERRITWDGDGGFCDRGIEPILEIARYATDIEKEAYRVSIGDIRIGDKVQIVSGRKMKGEVKTVSNFYTYRIAGTYGHGDVPYIVFADGTKVQQKHCKII